MLDSEREEGERKLREEKSVNEGLVKSLETLTATASLPSSSSAAPATTTGASEGVQSVLTYLRKGKEIAELQLELKQQEAFRFKSKVGILEKDLEDLRAELALVLPPLPSLSPFTNKVHRKNKTPQHPFPHPPPPTHPKYTCKRNYHFFKNRTRNCGLRRSRVQGLYIVLKQKWVIWKASWSRLKGSVGG